MPFGKARIRDLTLARRPGGRSPFPKTRPLFFLPRSGVRFFSLPADSDPFAMFFSFDFLPAVHERSGLEHRAASMEERLMDQEGRKVTIGPGACVCRLFFSFLFLFRHVWFGFYASSQTALREEQVWYLIRDTPLPWRFLVRRKRREGFCAFDFRLSKGWGVV